MTPGPTAAANASASTIFGKASAISVTRISTVSIQPPKKPATVPIDKPIGTTTTTTSIAIDSVMRAPSDEPGQDVAAKLVGAEPVRYRARRQQPVGQYLAQRIMRLDEPRTQ